MFLELTIFLLLGAAGVFPSLHHGADFPFEQQKELLLFQMEHEKLTSGPGLPTT